VELPESSRLVRAAAKACHAVLGSAQTVGLRESGHANRFAAAGVEAIALGPGDPRLARAPNEHVPVAQLVPAARIYLSLMRTGV